jgi:hypothetical protein
MFTDALSEKFTFYSGISANINGIIFNTLLFIIFPIYIIKLNKKNEEQKFEN